MKTDPAAFSLPDRPVCPDCHAPLPGTCHCGGDMKQCDVCGEMKSDVRNVYVSYAGDTSICEDCSQ